MYSFTIFGSALCLTLFWDLVWCVRFCNFRLKFQRKHKQKLDTETK